MLRGWVNYFRINNGNAARKFPEIDPYVRKRLVIFANVSTPGTTRRGREFDYRWYSKLGVYGLMGIIRYLARPQVA